MWESVAFVFTSRINDIHAWTNVYTWKLIPPHLAGEASSSREEIRLSTRWVRQTQHRHQRWPRTFLWCCWCRFSLIFYYSKKLSHRSSQSVGRKNPMPNVISGRQSETPMLEKSVMPLTINDNWWQYDDYLRLLMIYCLAQSQALSNLPLVWISFKLNRRFFIFRLSSEFKSRKSIQSVKVE